MRPAMRLAQQLVAVAVLVVVPLVVAQSFSVQNGSAPAPIKVEEAEALRLQIVYQQAIAAQNQLENALLRVKIKHKAPAEWGYSFERGQFEPPEVPKAPAAQPPPSPKEKPQ